MCVVPGNCNITVQSASLEPAEQQLQLSDFCASEHVTTDAYHILQGHDEGPLSYRIHLQSGDTLLVALHLCYDQGQARPGTPTLAAMAVAAAAAATAGCGAASSDCGTVTNGSSLPGVDSNACTSWCVR